MDSLAKLRELTNKITSWQPKEYHEGYIDVEMDEGESKMYKLMYEPEVAVSKVFISKDAKVKTHTHKQREFIILYKGEVVIETVQCKKTLTPGKFIYINAGEPHIAFANEDSWLIVVTVPASEVFPQ